MGWEDRPYYRENRGPQGGGGVLHWLMYGSVPLFTIFGIRVRAHAALIVLVGLVLLFGFGQGSTVAARVQSMSVLFAIILLHELGHCFGARWTGGSANEIVLTPLGGLAMTMARRRPWPTFVTVACGPLVNVLICLVCGAALYFIASSMPLTPGQFERLYFRLYFQDGGSDWLDVANWLLWIHGISYWLLLFNLLPVFPLDGGQLLQSILWRPMGYYKSMLLTLNIGLGGSVLMFMTGIATFGSLGGGFLLMFIALSCFMTCLQMRQMMRAEGPWAFGEEDNPVDFAGGGFGGGGGGYAVSYAEEVASRRKTNEKAARRAEKLAREEKAEQEQIDAILAKVSAHGMHSLSFFEKRALKQATERQRQRDLEREKRLRR